LPAEFLQEAKNIYGEPNVYRVSGSVAAVRSPTIDNPGDISAALRVQGDRTAAVLKLNGSHSGYYYIPFWDWLREAVT